MAKLRTKAMTLILEELGIKEMPLWGHSFNGCSTYLCSCGETVSEDKTVIYKREHICIDCAMRRESLPSKSGH